MSTNLEIDALVRKLFDFLTQENGFEGPRIEQGPLSVVYTYLHQRIALEIALDLRDQIASVMLVRLYDGQLPITGYYMSQGTRCRIYISELVRKGLLNPTDSDLEKLRNRGRSKAPLPILAQLEANQEVVKSHVGEILILDIDSIFEKLNN